MTHYPCCTALEPYDGVNIVRIVLPKPRTIGKLPAPPACAFPGCTEFGEHDHHITYDPPVIKRLCRRHHEDITILNGTKGRKYRHGLSNRHRWWIWYQWIEGKMKPRRTRKALAYIAEWDKT